ncbi:hypothetical protein BIPXVNHO_CDS0039 [Staphylococcus phage PG-2021_27]
MSNGMERKHQKFRSGRNGIGNNSYRQILGKYKTPRLAGKGDTRNTSTKLKSKPRKFKLSFVKMYRKLTEEELGYLDKYGLSLISEHIQISSKFLRLESYNDTTNLTNVTDYFYVKRGSDYIGKLIIKTQYTFKTANVTFMFYERTNIKFD